ncbi:aldose 1-epimerase family protein [Thermostilla marina]
MATKKWVFIDAAEQTYLESARLDGGELGAGFEKAEIAKSRLRGGLSDGVEVVGLDNGRMQLTILPTRGMGVWQAVVGDLRLGWQAPTRGPVHPAFVPIWDPSGVGWLDGFDELVVRCGLESNGAPEFNPDGTLRYPLHGKIANRPAHKVVAEVDEETGTMAVIGEVDETRLFFTKLRLSTRIETRVGSTAFTIIDTVENLSAEPTDMELLYHINIGAPLLDPGSKVLLPIEKMAPRDATAVENAAEWDRYGPESPGLREAVFYFRPAAAESGETVALLHNSGADLGACVRFDVRQLPCFTLWKNRQAVVDGYVTGLEPATNFPNTKSFEKEHGRVVDLAPGESRTFRVTVEALTDAAAVAKVQEEVRAVQGERAPEILQHPDPDWSVC